MIIRALTRIFLEWVWLVEDVLSKTVGAGLPFTSFDPIVDEILSFLVVASVSDGEAVIDLVSEAVKVFDNAILLAVREGLDEAALYGIEYTGLDAFDLIDCLGGDALSETISWAANTLVGASASSPESLKAYAECIGIIEDLLSADDKLVASAVIYSFVAAINKLLANLIV